MEFVGDTKGHNLLTRIWFRSNINLETYVRCAGSELVRFDGLAIHLLRRGRYLGAFLRRNSFKSEQSVTSSFDHASDDCNRRRGALLLRVSVGDYNLTERLNGTRRLQRRGTSATWLYFSKRRLNYSLDPIKVRQVKFVYKPIFHRRKLQRQTEKTSSLLGKVNRGDYILGCG